MEQRAGGREHVPVRLPSARVPPLQVLASRLGVALGLMLFVALVAYIGRDGYRDAAGGEVGVIDAVYYATVSITTTGYGDITPVTDGARLATILLITPARILFLILLVGTTVELLAERTRQNLRERLWRRHLNGHTIVCGYGTKGRTAIEVLLAKGLDRNKVVVIDSDPDAIERATGDGLAAVHGNAETTAVLETAGVRTAGAVVVAPDRDDSAVLMTLTARELNPAVTISAAVREEENAHLLRESGASSVITSSAAAGRLLGLATETPRLVDVLEDLLSVGEGLDIAEREVTPEEVGAGHAAREGELLVAVVRDGRMLRFDDPALRELRPGDRVLCLRSHADR
jgi:voltage-gated potassium channel